MKLDLAYTAPINPPGVSPLLSRSQVWKGLMEKCYKPQNFSSHISGCEILEENCSGMKRVVTFNHRMGGGKATEILTYHGQTTVDILTIETGYFMTTTISTGVSEHDLFLTFTFDGEIGEVQEDTMEVQRKGEQLVRQAATIVPSAIDEIRTMVREGRL